MKPSSLAWALMLLLVTVVAYAPAITGDFIWDDDSYVSENPLLLSIEGLRFIWFPGESPAQRTPQYYPVIFTTFWIENQIWGLRPIGYHVVNILLHGLNAILLWHVMRRIGVPFGWLVAAIFALHPVHVESVAWITERKNVLSGSFYLIAALCYMKFDDDNSRKRWLCYAAAMIVFVLALLSKSVTCSLPAALILVMLFQRKQITISRLAPLIPMFIVGIVAALNTAAVERSHVGAYGEDFAFTAVDRVLIASKALLFYPYKILIPWPVMFIYPRWSIDSASLLQFWPVALVGLMSLAFLWMYWRGWRGPALAAAFYAGTVFPALGFVNIYPMRFSFVADHFQYLASIGTIALAVATGDRMLRDQRVRSLAALLVLLMLSVLTFVQASTYESAEAVYRDTLSKNWEAWMPHNNLANILIHRDPIEAELHYREALRIKPDHYTAQSNIAEALRLQGRIADGIVEVQKAIRLIHEQMQRRGVTAAPRFLATDYVQLARLELTRGNLDAAHAAATTANAINPQLPEAHQLLNFIRSRREGPPIN